MKNKFIEVVAFILGAFTAVAGLLTLPHIAMLPADWQPYIAVALALVVVGKNGAYVLLDFLDDGKLNNSYRLPKSLPLILLAGMCLCLVSCADQRFLGISKSGWGTILQDMGKGALTGAAQAGLPAYQKERERTAAKAVLDVQP